VTSLETSLPGLPPAVADALRPPAPGGRSILRAGGRQWSFLAWGAASDPPMLLVHGVTSNAAIWWRVGPALAAAGRHVTAIDMPGHGPDPAWFGQPGFDATAGEVSAFINAAGFDVAELAVVGHSWGAMVSAHLPSAGIRPASIVLIDPPYLSLAQLEDLTREPTERPYPTLDEARAAVRSANPGWSDGDVEAKAVALTEFDADAVLAVLLQNGDWDSGLEALARPQAHGIPVWLITGEWASGCFIPDSAIPVIRRQLGDDRVITIPGAPHSPQRTHPEATVLAILRAIEADERRGTHTTAGRQLRSGRSLRGA
jgi:pimeloyl-ACP methyl ester carboxylesterase